MRGRRAPARLVAGGPIGRLGGTVWCRSRPAGRCSPDSAAGPGRLAAALVPFVRTPLRRCPHARTTKTGPRPDSDVRPVCSNGSRLRAGSPLARSPAREGSAQGGAQPLEALLGGAEVGRASARRPPALATSRSTPDAARRCSARGGSRGSCWMASAGAAPPSPNANRLSATGLTRTSSCPGSRELGGPISSMLRSSWLAASAAQIANTSVSVARSALDLRTCPAPRTSSVQAVPGAILGPRRRVIWVVKRPSCGSRTALVAVSTSIQRSHREPCLVMCPWRVASISRRPASSRPRAEAGMRSSASQQSGGGLDRSYWSCRKADWALRLPGFTTSLALPSTVHDGVPDTRGGELLRTS
jgi:hypothetical protein